MIPFVRTPDEMAQVVRQIDDYGLERHPEQEGGFQLWMMVEVPSNVLLLDEFIDCGIDGVSIGSNDSDPVDAWDRSRFGTLRRHV